MHFALIPLKVIIDALQHQQPIALKLWRRSPFTNAVGIMADSTLADKNQAV